VEDIDVKSASSLLETILVVVLAMTLSMVLIQTAFNVYDIFYNMKEIESTSDFSVIKESSP
tara:strand:+ start:186 stop:368 length:183 start_codon:yes stop_codon:yes gene_type:complete